MPPQQCSSGDNHSRPAISREPLPFTVGQVCTIPLAVEITHIFPRDLEQPHDILRCRVLSPWGQYKYWDCTEQELLGAMKP